MRISLKMKINLLLAMALLTACESFGPSMRDKLPIEPVAVLKDEDRQQHNELFTQLDLDGDEEEKKKPTVEMYPGTGSYISGGVSRAASGRSAATGRYTLNFDDADLGEVAKVVLSDTLSENYVLSPAISGRVTLQTTRPLTREELIPTLEMLLRMNGAVLIKSSGGYRIEPAANALQGANSPRLAKIGQSIPEGYQIRIIPLRYVGVEEMQKILEPLLPPKSIVRVDKARNLMVVAGTGAELGNILDTIELFDVNVLKGMSVLMYPLKNVDAATAVAELESIFSKDTESPLAGMFRVIAIERMNSVMVITPQPRYLREARVWLDRLDRSIEETGAGGGGVYVYRVQNVEAADLASILNDIFSKSKKSSTPGAQIAPGRSAAEIGGEGDNKASKPRASSSSQISLGGTSEAKIIADEKNNSLVIVATAQEYEVLKKVIKHLDVQPLEVLIDATIVEVSLTDELRYGIQWFFRHSVGPYGATAVLSDVSGGQTPVIGGAANGFSYTITNSPGEVRAVLTALADKSKINIVASPSLMVLNNQEAFINVGDQVPVATSQSTNTNSATVADTSTNAIVTNQIQMIDTGVTLRIKPRVNSGGLVIMEVEQEANQAVATTTSGLDSPTIQQRKIESTVAVQSGDTIVLGGLIRDQRTITVNGIPYLSDIPYLGWLFGRNVKQLDRTELVVLITPRVVANRKDGILITNEFKRKLTGIYEGLSEDEQEDNQQFEAIPQAAPDYQ